jgi:hypothetical protein
VEVAVSLWDECVAGDNRSSPRGQGAQSAACPTCHPAGGSAVDTLGRRFHVEGEPLALVTALRATWEPVLGIPWILDMVVTIRPIYGHQEGAKVGDIPHKAGRPAHAHHLLIHRGTRLPMDVEARSGMEHAPNMGWPTFGGSSTGPSRSNGPI